MTQLEAFVAECGLDPIEVLNDLQEDWIVSDNCVTLADVAECDATRAMKWLDEKMG